MKKMEKLISIIMIVTVLISMSVNFPLALTDPIEIAGDDSTDVTGITGIGNQIVTIVSTVGSVASVIVLVILGLKYMMGSAEEKAEYKKTLMPYVIGAALVFAASSIASIIFNFTSQLGGGATSELVKVMVAMVK